MAQSACPQDFTMVANGYDCNLLRKGFGMIRERRLCAQAIDRILMRKGNLQR